MTQGNAQQQLGQPQGKPWARRSFMYQSRIRPSLLVVAPLIVILGCSASPNASNIRQQEAQLDDVDRIVAAIGVDAMHSVDEEARTRDFAREVLNSTPALAELRTDPELERVARHMVLDNRRMRRDPLVLQAYRTTLERALTLSELKAAAEFYSSTDGRKNYIALIEADKAAQAVIDEGAKQADDPAVRRAYDATLGRMLTPAEVKFGATFYGNPAGQKTHSVLLDAEMAAGAAMDAVAERENKATGAGSFTHYFLYGRDVFFARDSAEMDASQRERVNSILRMPREAEPGKPWCVLVVGYSGTDESSPDVVTRRLKATEAVLLAFGIPESSISLDTRDAVASLLTPGSARASITEIEQYPCTHG